MYVSLVKRTLFRSVYNYLKFKEQIEHYNTLVNFYRKFHNFNNPVLYKILSGEDTQNWSQRILAEDLDVYHLLFNIYNFNFSNRTGYKLKLFLPYILNSFDKYDVEDLSEIEVESNIERVKRIRNMMIGKNFFCVNDYKFMSVGNNNIVKNKPDLKALASHFMFVYEKPYLESKSLAKSIETYKIFFRICNIIKERYLSKIKLDDASKLLDNIENSDFTVDFSIDMCLFYHSSNFLFSSKLLINIHRNKKKGKYSKEFKFFIRPDKMFYHHKDLYGNHETVQIKDEDLLQYKKDLFKSAFVLKKRNEKVSLF